MIGLSFNKIVVILIFFVIMADSSLFAQDIPGSADAGRIQPSLNLDPNFNTQPSSQSIDKGDINGLIPPDGADSIMIQLNDLQINGVTAYSQSDILPLYSHYIGQDIPLSTIWKIANAITKLYQDDGYFLSRAIIPQQEIDDGSVVIQIVEGYIADVNMQGSRHALSSYITDQLMNERPLQFASLESALLRLNDIHGLQYQSTLRPLPTNLQSDNNAYGVQLYLTATRENSNATVTLNNYGSRFAGPHRANLVYQTSVQNGHLTTLSGLFDTDLGDELWAGTIRHDVNITETIDIFGSFSKTISKPGFTLEPNEIISESFAWQLGAAWTPLRQRMQNFTLTGSLNSQDVETDILGQALTRDYIRTASLNALLNITEASRAKNIFQLTFTQGLSVFGASDKGDLNLSRAEADPNFSKIEFLYQRDQVINNQFLLTGLIQGQKSDSPLFSSQEFGYGGPHVGRAYDGSEIAGDNGLSALLKIQYMNMPVKNNLKFIPLAFYDIGKVWNIDDGQIDQVSASSAGIGLEFFNQKYNYFGSLGLAVPLTKNIETPIYGQNNRNPRLSFQLGYKF